MANKLLKKIYFDINYFIKSSAMLSQIKDNNYLTILNLHRVSPNKNLFYPALEPKLFEELIKYLLKHFNIITFNQIEEFKNSKKPNVILSFDDGFYDFLEYAVPIMQKYNVRANQNVIPECIISGKPIWDVRLGDILNQLSYDEVNSIEFAGFDMKLNSNNKSQYGLALTSFLKNHKRAEREELFTIFYDLIRQRDIKLTKMMSKDEIKEISNIHEIGAHSFSHESMAIEGDEFFKEDFQKCKEFFDNELQIPLDIYAFPSGSYTQSQLNYLENSGVKHILLVNENYSNYSSNKYDRFTFYGDFTNEIKLRALGWRR